MNGFTPEQEIALCENEIKSWVRERDRHQRDVDMFNDMIADNKRRIAEARAKIAYCPCGWKPREGIIGGETLEEHQVFCHAATESSDERGINMNLYVIYTRQSERVDSQYFSAYHVWAESEAQAKLLFQQRLKYAVIKDVSAVSADNGPLLLLATR